MLAMTVSRYYKGVLKTLGVSFRLNGLFIFENPLPAQSQRCSSLVGTHMKLSRFSLCPYLLSMSLFQVHSFLLCNEVTMLTFMVVLFTLKIIYCRMQRWASSVDLNYLIVVFTFLPSRFIAC